MLMRKMASSIYDEDIPYRNEIIKMNTLEEQILFLEPLCQKIRNASNVHDKLEILNSQPYVQSFVDGSHTIKTFLAGLTPECDLAIKSILAIEQGPVVFNGIEEVPDKYDALRRMLQILLEVDKFYSNIGGIIGYHCKVLQLINEKKGLPQQRESNYIKPPGFDLFKESPEVFKAIREGIDNLPRIAEIYPVGGAGDRLKLADENTGEPLPSAQLAFTGRTLLEGLVRDLQAKEYLYFKLHGKQILTPVTMMTSHEKNNHARIIQICQDAKWFGRPPESFKLFIQPLVPVITDEGNWSLKAPLSLTLKPGGHGVIWKLAMENGVFDWLEELGRDKALLRQINNPIAGTDYGILAFAGYGCLHDKAFGFASCPRLLKASEGMILLIETPTTKGYDYCITNIEYTDFQCKGIKDIPEEAGSRYSAFPANTNILFVDLEQIKKALNVCAIPGMLVNMKSMASYIDSEGKISEKHAGRLESTMQNIADYIINSYPSRLKEKEYAQLKTFVTYNDRRKTISVTKNEYRKGGSHQETPEGSFLEYLSNCHDLLKNYCKTKMPELRPEESALVQGPSFLFHYHPALGPLYRVIAKKFRGGELSPGSELYLEIAEADIEGLNLSGSLHILAEDVLGAKDSQGLVKYGQGGGKCELKNVTVKNRGVDWDAASHYWKHEIVRNETMVLRIAADGEFFAQDVVFEGDILIEVPAGTRMEAYMDSGEVRLRTRALSGPTWHWEYFYTLDNAVEIRKA